MIHVVLYITSYSLLSLLPDKLLDRLPVLPQSALPAIYHPGIHVPPIVNAEDAIGIVIRHRAVQPCHLLGGNHLEEESRNNEYQMTETMCNSQTHKRTRAYRIPQRRYEQNRALDVLYGVDTVPLISNDNIANDTIPAEVNRQKGHHMQRHVLGTGESILQDQAGRGRGQ